MLELLALGRSARDLAAELAMSPDTLQARAEHPDEAGSSLATGGRRSRDPARSTATFRPPLRRLSPSPLQRTEDVPTHMGRHLRRRATRDHAWPDRLRGGPDASSRARRYASFRPRSNQ